ncbi:MAG: CotH kinase family protein, partial [Planctomycetota bacterium]
MYTKNLTVLISFILLLSFVGLANATYTDYIGAGHDSGVTVDTCINDETATGAKTVDGSGLSGPSGTHDTVWDHGWLAYAGATNPNSARSSYTYWIHYDLGQVYALADMWVWNSNEDGYTNRGLKNVYIDYSTNGSTWTPLTSTQFSEATGSGSYAGFQGPDFSGTSARHVLISMINNWGAADWAGLAEVKFNISTGPPDTDPPTPDPATWASPPAATSPYTIEMTATTATDPSGVEYFFEETTDKPGGSDSSWQTNPSYTDSSLAPETQYTYRTRSRDQSINNNLTDWSSPPASATTDPEDTTAPEPNPATWVSPPAADSPWQISMTATTATDPSGVQYFFDETTGGGSHDSVWQASLDYTNSGLTPETQYTYQVRTRDQSPNQNTGSWSTPPASATTDEIPSGECPDGDLDDDCDNDIDDLVIFAGQWLDNPPCVGISDPNACADLDEENDDVDGEDFAILAGDWQEEGVFAPTILVINEIMSNNDTTHQDPADNDYEDWIEIFNAGILPVNMAGMYLADDGNIWEIPSGIIIEPGEYELFWADNETSQGIYHTNFALSASGDSVTLYDTDGVTTLDTVTFGELSDDISYGRWPNITGDFLNMDSPTPDAENSVGMASEVHFSRPGGTFYSNFTLGMTTKSPTATIRYTTDKSEPTGSSNLYTAPITISQNTWVRARAYDSGLDPSPITSKAYFKLHSNIYNFETNLPIVVIDTFEFNVDNEEERDFQQVIAAFIEPDDITGTAVITNPADWSGIGGMHIRGESSTMYDKKQYRFETWDENNPDPSPSARYRDMDVSLLGMPADSDWIIHAPWSDKTLMRNYQMYTWSRQIGRYAVRCRFVELFLDKNDGNSTISSDDYWGVYVFMEKIKRDRNRIDLAQLGPSDNAEPEITGGYVLDKGGEDYGFETIIYSDDITYVDPVGTELTSTQKTWIEDHFNEFESALAGVNYNNPAHANYYGNYIDIGSFVDHHILVEFSKNVDGLVLSTYLFKDRGGKINMGPIWDYNGSLGGADYLCNWVPQGWWREAHDEDCCPDEVCCVQDSCWRFPLSEGGCEEGEASHHYAWYDRLMEDPEFLLAYADNWFDHREDEFKTANMIADVNDNVTVLTTNVGGTTPVSRNFTKWDILEEGGKEPPYWPNYYDNCNATGATYMDYVNWMTGWIDDRLTWMDGAIDTSYGDAPPVIKVNGANKNRGAYITTSDSISMTGGGTIYYTNDGSDPRAHGGGI